MNPLGSVITVIALYAVTFSIATPSVADVADRTPYEVQSYKRDEMILRARPPAEQAAVPEPRACAARQPCAGRYRLGDRLLQQP